MWNWRAIVDFLVLSFSIYVLLRWAARARALRFALTITTLYAASLLARDVNLVITSWVLQVATFVAIASMLLVFQTEIRSALMQLDSRILSWTETPRASPGGRAIAEAAFSLAEREIGALIVVVKNDRIDELVQGGVPVRAEVTPALLDAIFQKTSALHDGAALVQHGTITMANVVLPLTQEADVPSEYGTRHRAAMGLSEKCDAVVVVVSEERGTVSVTRRREVIEVASPEQLGALLRTPGADGLSAARSRLRGALTDNWRHKLAAVALATVVFAGILLSPDNIVRTVQIPIEFTNLPDGYDLKQQSSTSMEAQLRGRTWVMASTDFSGLVARFDLKEVEEGVRRLPVQSAKIDLPAGVVIEEVRPENVSVVVIKQRKPDED